MKKDCTLFYIFKLHKSLGWFGEKLKIFLTLQAALLLRKQLAELNKNPVEGFSAGLIDDEDIFRWEVGGWWLVLHLLYSVPSCDCSRL